MRKVNEIILHHTADNLSFDRIREIHMVDNKWSDIAYHYLIDLEGEIHEGRPINRMFTSRRPNAIEIGVVGKLHKENIKKIQHEQLKMLLSDIYKKYGKIKVYGHKEKDATLCPGNLDIDYYRNYFDSLYNKNQEINKMLNELELIIKRLRGEINEL